jgi:hypothetical protein
VRQYRLRANGRILAEVTDNIQRHCMHRLPEPIRTDSILLECLATQGGGPPRVFEIRVY